MGHPRPPPSARSRRHRSSARSGSLPKQRPEETPRDLRRKAYPGSSGFAGGFVRGFPLPLPYRRAGSPALRRFWMSLSRAELRFDVAEEAGHPGERKLFGGWQLREVEPAQLRHVVPGSHVAGEHARLEDEVQHRRSALAVGIDVGAAVGAGLDLEPGLLEQLAAKAIERRLALLEEAAEEVPATRIRLVRAQAEEGAFVLDDERRYRGRRLRVRREAARGARRLALVDGQRRSAARTEPLTGQGRHPRVPYRACLRATCLRASPSSPASGCSRPCPARPSESSPSRWSEPMSPPARC